MTPKKHLQLLNAWVDRQKEVLKEIHRNGFLETIGENETFEEWLYYELDYLFSLIQGDYLDDIEDLI
jgi:hypothetical protein